MYYNTPADGLERSLVDNTDVPEDKEKKKLDDILNSTPILESPMNENYEEPKRKGDEGFPPPELKPLPKELKYKFLDDTNKYPVIISADLSEKEENRLMIVLKERRRAFGYSMDDLKGISPSIATHRIFMEEGAQPVAEFQRRLKPEMKEVVIKEIIRLLDAGIIYHVKESDWVSPVHCVPKKGGFTVMANEIMNKSPQGLLLGIECVLITGN